MSLKSPKWKFTFDVILASLFIFSLGILADVIQDELEGSDLPLIEFLVDSENVWWVQDYVRSQKSKEIEPDTNIVLINIGTINRGEIAKIVESVNEYKPRVLGVDFVLGKSYDDNNDSLLTTTLSNCENLLFVNRVIYNPQTDDFDSMYVTHNKFSKYGDVSYANLVAIGSENVRTRVFLTATEVESEVYFPFGVELARKYDYAKVESFYERGNLWEYIDYSGNYIGSNIDQPVCYKALDFQEVLDGKADMSIIRDKIVILGFLGYELGDPWSSEDKYYTPLNSVVSGGAEKDMYGAVVHANIASMILAGSFIDETTVGMDIGFALLVLVLNVTLFCFIHLKIPLWYHPITKLIQITEILLIVYLSIVLFREHNYFVPIGAMIFYAAIVGDSLEVYFGILKRLTSKKGRKELFTINS